MSADESEKDRHLSFLKDEFEKNGFFSADPFGLNEIALQELVDTIFEPSFEGRVPTHGAIICSHGFDEYEQNLPKGTRLPSVPRGRIFCDGVKTFRVICPESEGIISLSDCVILNELDLFTIRDDVLYKHGGEDHESSLKKDIYLLKRSGHGEITLLCREGIAIHRDARLSFFKYQYHFKRVLLDYISENWDSNPWHNQVLDSIFRISIHVLGADPGVGGTIILLHPEDEAYVSRLINDRNAIPLPRNFKVTLRDHQSLLVTLMRNTDGAVLIDHSGEVRSARNWLVIPNDVLAQGGSEGGTRHLTGQLFSTLIRGLVFVVSSDGPVTLYAGGTRVFRTCERR